MQTVKVTLDKKILLKALPWGVLASLFLLGVYFIVLSLISGWSFTQQQFFANWYYIVPLTLGFGAQIILFRYLKALHAQMRKSALAVSGATSTAAMLSCCAHYLVNILPVLGATGLVTIAAQYQTEFFWVGLLSNALGIGYLLKKIWR